MKLTQITAGLIALGIAFPLAAQAGTRCKVPMAEWQPREAVEAKLKAEGWTVERLKTDDGCYKVYGKDPQGRRVEAKFDPATLALVKSEQDND